MSQQTFHFHEKATVNVNPEPAPPEDARKDGINVKFSEKEKEEIRAIAYGENTGMSTLLYEAWQFYKEFRHVKSQMLRFKKILVTHAITLEKEL